MSNDQPTRDQSTAYCMICGGPAPCETHTFHGEVPANKTTDPHGQMLIDPFWKRTSDLEVENERLRAEIDRLKAVIRSMGGSA